MPEQQRFRDALFELYELRIQLINLLKAGSPENCVELPEKRWYNQCVTAPKPVRKGGVYMEPILAFIVAVVAGVVCHYIIKWLDGDK